MGTTTQQLGPDFVKQMVTTVSASLEEGRRNAYIKLWNEVLMPHLHQHWLGVLEILVAILAAAFLTWIITGRWAWLGSVLYNYFYWGTLFIMGLTWGPAVFAKGFMDVFLVGLYIVCFTIVGILLRRK